MAGLMAIVIAFAGIGVFSPDAAMGDMMAAAKKEGSVTVYHTANRRAVKALAKLYTKKFGIKVNWTRKGTGGTIRMFEAERLAGALKCDVVSVGDPSTFIRWKKEKVLMKYVSPSSKGIFKKLLDPDHYSLPDRADYMAISYSPKRVKKSEMPSSWLDIVKPSWKGRVATIDPAKSGPARIWVAGIVQKFGWDFFRKLAKLKPLVLKSYSTSAVALISGEADIVVPGNEGDTLIRRNKGEPVDVIYPKDGVVFRNARVGICAKAPHPNAAKLWIDLETGKEGQALLHKVRGYIPITKGVKVTIPRPKDVTDKMIVVDDAWFLKNKKAMMKKFSKIMSGRE
jgi:iron(III) transport system substrate-binding protein